MGKESWRVVVGEWLVRRFIQKEIRAWLDTKVGVEGWRRGLERRVGVRGKRGGRG